MQNEIMKVKTPCLDAGFRWVMENIGTGYTFSRYAMSRSPSSSSLVSPIQGGRKEEDKANMKSANVKE